MNRPALYRKRFIPDEIICLKDDEIIFMDEHKIVTKWHAIRPRTDFVRGCSCFFLDLGFKVSKFIDANGVCLYYYCDIIETEYREKENAYIFHDLLIDVLVYNDGFVKVLDLAEIPEALEKGLITVELTKKVLTLTDELLNIIYNGHFNTLTQDLEQVG